MAPKRPTTETNSRVAAAAAAAAVAAAQQSNSKGAAPRKLLAPVAAAVGTRLRVAGAALVVQARLAGSLWAPIAKAIGVGREVARRQPTRLKGEEEEEEQEARTASSSLSRGQGQPLGVALRLLGRSEEEPLLEAAWSVPAQRWSVLRSSCRHSLLLVNPHPEANACCC